jgi:hypothetical protein
MSETKKTYKCPFCDKKYVEKQALYNHMEKEHKEQLNGLPPAQVYFNYKNKKDHGSCIICGKNTKFNLQKERYERLCDNPKCKEAYRQQFLNRMRKTYGKDTLLNDEEQQKKMLANRKISGEYVWSTNSKFKFTYVGQYEKEFLEFMDLFMNWTPSDLFAPAPVCVPYTYGGKKHLYYPDFYVPSLNLIIEIKAYDNKHYRERDIEIEKTKDRAMQKSEYNYAKVHDKQYDEFFKYIKELILKTSI